MGGLFYVYEHWRPDRGECFYVGKGHGARRKAEREKQEFLKHKIEEIK